MLRAWLSVILSSTFCRAGFAGTSPEVVAPSVSQGITAGGAVPDLTIPKMILTPGEPLSMGAGIEDLKATYDVDLARKQVAAYPNDPNAHFILAVALTRTNYVEEALREVKQSRRLAEAYGGPSYFDKTISTYEELLKNYPEENQVRYELAWAYYMKAYLVAKHYQRMHNAAQNPNSQGSGHKSPDLPWELAGVARSNGNREAVQAKK